MNDPIPDVMEAFICTLGKGTRNFMEVTAVSHPCQEVRSSYFRIYSAGAECPKTEDHLRKQGPISSKQDNHMSSRTGSNSAGDTQAEPQVLSIFSSSPERTFSQCQAQASRVKFLKEQDCPWLASTCFTLLQDGVSKGFNFQALHSQVQKYK